MIANGAWPCPAVLYTKANPFPPDPDAKFVLPRNTVATGCLPDAVLSIAEAFTRTKILLVENNGVIVAARPVETNDALEVEKDVVSVEFTTCTTLLGAACGFEP